MSSKTRLNKPFEEDRMSEKEQTASSSEQEIDARMARIDGAMGAAGHVVTDPEARANVRRVISGEITAEEARADVLRRHEERKVKEDEIDARMARVDGVMGAAGYIITDPVIRQLLRRQAAGEITGEEARRAMAAHRDQQHYTP